MQSLAWQHYAYNESFGRHRQVMKNCVEMVRRLCRHEFNELIDEFVLRTPCSVGGPSAGPGQSLVPKDDRWRRGWGDADGLDGEFVALSADEPVAELVARPSRSLHAGEAEGLHDPAGVVLVVHGVPLGRDDLEALRF